MRVAYENFYQKLLATKKCVDINEIEKYISKSTSNDVYLIKRQIYRANKLLDERYKRYGLITEKDNIEAIRKGYFDLGKLSLTLDDIRKRISEYHIESESPMGMQIQRDWNYAVALLQDLLQVENMNLITYIRVLEERRDEILEEKAHKKQEKTSPKGKKEKEAKTTKNSYFPNNVPKDIITVEEICELMDLSKSKIYHMACNREIPHYKLNPSKKGRLYFSRSEIEAWLKKRRIGTTEEFCRQFD